MRIMIVGYSASGKSTLAKAFSKKYQLPLLSIDQLQFLPNWVAREATLRDRDLLTFIESNQSWVIDGNYFHSHWDKRAELADQIIILTMSRITSLMNTFKRYIQYRGKVRDDVAEGCVETINLEFLMWILFHGRTKTRQTFYEQLLETYPSKVTRLTSMRQLQWFLRENNLNEH